MQLKRRTGMILAGIGAATAATASSALTSIQADRQAQVSLTSDTDAYLKLDQAATANGAEYISFTSNGEMMFSFDAIQPGGNYGFDNTLRIENHSPTSKYIWAEVIGGDTSKLDFWLYNIYDSPKLNGTDAYVEAPSGKGFNLGVAINMADSATTQVGYELDVRIYASETAPAGALKADSPEAIDKGVGSYTGNIDFYELDISPTSKYYTLSTGMKHREQDDSATSTANVPYYEVQADNDTLAFDLDGLNFGLADPRLGIRTLFGEIAFDVIDTDKGETVVSEYSGFDSNFWWINPESGEHFRITNFSSSKDIDATQAAIADTLYLADAAQTL